MHDTRAIALSPSEYYTDAMFSDRIVAIMKKGNILPAGTPADMLAELTRRLLVAERSLKEPDGEAEEKITDFYNYIRKGICVLGSPLLTNIAAGHQTLASCTAVPIRTDVLSADDLNLAEAYYKLNVGSGYDLTSATDPCKSLILLNDHAEAIESSNACERYVGNIAHVNIRHPRIKEFIKVKTTNRNIIHFNTSIDIDEAFMEALANQRTYKSSDGTLQSAEDVWNAIVDAAWACGDPGLISLDRYNKGNALAAYSPYVTTAPCAEVGLAPGESCVFGYINLAACIRMQPYPSLDLALIGSVARCLTRILDDALELSITGFPDIRTQAVMSGKRKIGIGICGFADALLWLGIDYGCDASCQMLADALATINFESKVASLTMAKRRGPFLAFPQSAYAHDVTFLERFGEVPSLITRPQWKTLSNQVMKKGLRNVMTTALPPSGRSALLCGVNPSIEPYLRLQDPFGAWVTPVRGLMESGHVALGARSLSVNGMATNSWPICAANPTSLFRISTQITPEEHFRILGTATGLVDDGVSKTINLESTASRETVDSIFRAAWEAGLKAISVYRDARSEP